MIYEKTVSVSTVDVTFDSRQRRMYSAARKCVFWLLRQQLSTRCVGCEAGCIEEWLLFNCGQILTTQACRVGGRHKDYLLVRPKRNHDDCIAVLWTVCCMLLLLLWSVVPQEGRSGQSRPSKGLRWVARTLTVGTWRLRCKAPYRSYMFPCQLSYLPNSSRAAGEHGSTPPKFFSSILIAIFWALQRKLVI